MNESIAIASRFLNDWAVSPPGARPSPTAREFSALSDVFHYAQHHYERAQRDASEIVDYSGTA